MIGLVVWWRRVGAKAALAWIAILGLTATQLIMLQNRSYARYAVGVQMATAPLLAGAGSLVAPPVAVVGLLGMTAYAAGSSLPLLREQHDETFGAWEATVDASRRAADRGWAAVVEPEVHVFSVLPVDGARGRRRADAAHGALAAGARALDRHRPAVVGGDGPPASLLAVADPISDDL